MMNLGIEDDNDEVKVEYDMKGNAFYAPDYELEARTDAKMAPVVKSECNEFDKLISTYKVILERKTSIM